MVKTHQTAIRALNAHFSSAPFAAINKEPGVIVFSFGINDSDINIKVFQITGNLTDC